MHVSYAQDTEDQFRTHQAQQSVPEVPSVWTPPAHKRSKSTSAPFFLRGHRSLARSLKFDVINLCCSRGISSLSWFLTLKIASKTMIPPSFFPLAYSVVVANASFNAAVLPSGRPTHGVRLDLVINSASAAYCQDLQVYHHTPLVTRHTKHCSRSLSGTFTTSSIEQHGLTSNTRQLCRTSIATGPTKENRFNTPLNKLE